MGRFIFGLFLTALILFPACSDSGNGSDEDAAEDDGCGPGLVLCGSLCVDLTSDRNHCGACGQPCRRGEICTAGTCGPGCVDECVTFDDSRCALYPPNYVETCGDSDGDGCFEWGDLSPCPRGATCEDGVCSEGCPVICDEAGDTRCTADVWSIETCGDYDSDGCLEWGGEVACPEGERCVDGECQDVGPPCGNDHCELGESCDSCPADCGDCLLVCAVPWEWDLGSDFSSIENPAGAWSYGWTFEPEGVGFTPGTPYDLGRMKGWAGENTTIEGRFPAVMQNQSTVSADYGGAMYEPGDVAMVPSELHEQAVVRWTSENIDLCWVDAHFEAMGSMPGGIWVVQDSLPHIWLDLSAGEDFFNEPMPMGPGSTIQFALDGGLPLMPVFEAAVKASVRILKQSWFFIEEFEPGCNPLGQWEFGYASSTALFQSYAVQGFREVVNPYWSRSGPVTPDGLQSYVWKNNTAGVVDSVYTGQFALHPGCFDDPARCGEEWAVVRWVSPFDGHVMIFGTFGAGGSGRPDLAIIHESGSPTLLWSQTDAFTDESFDADAMVAIGDTINAVVGDAYEGGDTPLEIQIEAMEMFPP